MYIKYLHIIYFYLYHYHIGPIADSYNIWDMHGAGIQCALYTVHVHYKYDRLNKQDHIQDDKKGNTGTQDNVETVGQEYITCM